MNHDTTPFQDGQRYRVRSHLAVITLLTLGLLIGTAMFVGHSRGKHGIKAPAASGHPDFERAFRLQMNTHEAALAFLPTLWLAAHYWSALVAGLLGLMWVTARVWYAIAYARDAAWRGPAFIVAFLALAGLAATATAGVARATPTNG